MMKWLVMITGFSLLPAGAYAQTWQSLITLDSRTGYTTNTYLMPYSSDWNRSDGAVFFSVAPVGQLRYNGNRFHTDLTGAVFFEPVAGEEEAGSGAFGMVNNRFRLSDQWTVGLESGANYTRSEWSRQSFWMQPVVTYSPNLFTQFRVKAGSAFLDNELHEDHSGPVRYDQYVAEAEFWRGFRWQFRAGIHGGLDQPLESLGGRASASYQAGRSLQMTLRAGLNRYSYQVMTEGNGGFPTSSGSELSESDRLTQAGLGSVYQLNDVISLAVNADYLYYTSSADTDGFSDLQLSAGIRFSLTSSLGRRSGADVDWRMNGDQTVRLRIDYSGDGDLYILGEFNEWDHPGVPLSRQSRNRYVARLDLDPGAYEYKILLIEDGEETWIDFSEDTYTVPDGFGSENGLIFID